ncbi:MAG: lysophospholipid acyltransferase family protein [Prevotellaceae bacterium]|jgi:predicted LPLAT superfamily acyltransferase|nr:lysophospholipid acyltransferase family protein [Prevotellaceae bacterium]
MRLWQGKSRGGAFGYRFFIFLITHLGIKFAYFFLLFVAIHFIPFAPLATRWNWYYFRKIQRYGMLKTVGMLYLNYYRLGQSLIDKMAVRLGMQARYQYEFENYDAFLKLLNGNTGVVLIGAHVGNWEIGGSFFGEYAKKIHIVMLDAEARKIKQVLEKNLDSFRHKIIPLSEQNLEHIYKIKEALDNKEYVCFQGDRRVSEKMSRTMDFFGKPAAFPEGPFYLAWKFKAPVAFYFSMREKGMKYRFKFFIAGAPPDSGETKPALALMQQYVRALESVLRQYPEQWFNYYKFWNA